MRVLLVHNSYQVPGGEDVVFSSESELLSRNGVEVVRLVKHNDTLRNLSLSRRVIAGYQTAWRNDSYREIAATIKRLRPDVAHFHNTFPLVTPSAYGACQDHGVPVIQTLHNYRLICAGALLQRDGQPCEECVGRSLLPALRHRCYRRSLSETGAVVWMLWRNRRRGTYQKLVDRYIALTHFAAGRLIAGGLPKDRISIKPNFLSNPPSQGAGSGGYAVYVGRLSKEKGVDTLLSAWERIKNVGLKIVGDGPLRAELEERAKLSRVAVEFLGHRPRSEVLNIVSEAEFQVVPSEQYEGFPLVVLEAYACGTPVVASRIGSLDEIVAEGVTGAKFVPGRPDDLAQKIAALLSDRARLRDMRFSTRAVFDEKYGADRNFKMLMQIYADVLGESGPLTGKGEQERQ